MNTLNSGSSQVADSWDTYWRGTGDVGAYSSGGANHPAILAFWDEFFHQVNQGYDKPRIIDIASGNGAVVERALAAFGNEKPDFTCLDVSAAAINNIRERFPFVNGVVTDASNIPFDSGSFDIATSQFGIEYAGPDAIKEVGRLVENGGRLAFLLHSQLGSIHRECKENLDATARLKESRFIPYAIEMFRTGFAAIRGADRAPYESAAKKLAPAIATVESIIKQYGEHVADDTVARLYSDVGQIHKEIQFYEPDDILSWLNRMQDELDAYQGRMSSMSNSALDSDAFKQICDQLSSEDFSIERAEPLVVPDTDLPLAWILIATKQQSKTSGDIPNNSSGKDVGENTDSAEREKLKAWVKKQLQTAVYQFIDQGAVDGPLVEAKPAWMLPFQILIGKIRPQGQSQLFEWFICGDVPTDFLESAVAPTPKDVARHFALKWQLQAARDLSGKSRTESGPDSQPENSADKLADTAEALYALLDDTRLWKQ